MDRPSKRCWQSAVQGRGSDPAAPPLRERREEPEAVDEEDQAAQDGRREAPVELVAEHGELRVVGVGRVLPAARWGVTMADSSQKKKAAAEDGWAGCARAGGVRLGAGPGTVGPTGPQ